MAQLTLDLPCEVSREQVRLFVRLHQLETWIREMVYMEMKCNFADAWWAKCEGALRRAGRNRFPARKAMGKDKQHSHMATPENDPLWFTTLDATLAILFDRYLWSLFTPCLTTKTLVQAKFDELKPVRNRTAHARAIHPDDLRRVENILSDLDSGFWKFCTSYNHVRPFIANRQSDPVFRHFADRMGGGYVEVRSGVWAEVANRVGMVMDMGLGYSIRPFSAGPRSERSARGRATFSVAHSTGRCFRTADVLTRTEGLHGSLLYIHIDSMEAMITVTIPSKTSTRTVIEILEQFYDACRGGIRGAVKPEAQVEDGDYMRWYDQHTARSVALGAEWPHYVLTPVNPLTFLEPDQPCGFFGSL